MEAKPKINFRKEREMGEVLSDTFSFIRENYKPLFQVILKVMVPVLVLLLIAFSVFYLLAFKDFESTLTMLGGDISEDFGTKIGWAAFTGSSAFLLIAALFYAVYFAALNFSIESYIHTGEIHPAEVSKKVWRHWTGFYGLSFLVGILLIFGLILCFIPGIYFSVPLSLVFSIMAFEGLGAFQSIRKGFKLIRFNWWSSFFTLFIMGIIFYLGSSIFQIPALIYSLVQSLTMMKETTGDTAFLDIYDLPYLIMSLIGMAARFLLYGIVIVSTVFIYFSLNEKHYQTGALEAIENLGEEG